MNANRLPASVRLAAPALRDRGEVREADLRNGARLRVLRAPLLDNGPQLRHLVEVQHVLHERPGPLLQVAVHLEQRPRALAVKLLSPVVLDDQAAQCGEHDHVERIHYGVRPARDGVRGGRLRDAPVLGGKSLFARLRSETQRLQGISDAAAVLIGEAHHLQLRFLQARCALLRFIARSPALHRRAAGDSRQRAGEEGDQERKTRFGHRSRSPRASDIAAVRTHHELSDYAPGGRRRINRYARRRQRPRLRLSCGPPRTHI